MQYQTQEREALRYPVTIATTFLVSAGCGITGLALQMGLPDSMASAGQITSSVLYCLSAVAGAATWLLVKEEQSCQDNSLSTLTSKPLTEAVLDSSVIPEHSGIIEPTMEEIDAAVRQDRIDRRKQIKMHAAPELLSAKTSFQPSVSACPHRLVAYSAQSSMTNLPQSLKRGKKSRSGLMGTEPGSKGECKGCALSSSCTLDKSITSTAPVIQKITVKRRSKNG